MIETFPMIVTGYVSSEAEALTPTAIVTGASDEPLEFWMRYKNVNADARMLSWQCTSTLRSRAPFITELNSSKSSYVGSCQLTGMLT